MEAVLKEHGLTVFDVVLFTLDGAANGTLAVFMMKAQYRVCIAHQLQRCIMYATGQAGGRTSSNQGCKDFVAKLRKQSKAIKQSNVALIELKEEQEKGGVEEHDTLTIVSDNATRWGGTHQTAERSNVLSKHIKSIMRGTAQADYDDNLSKQPDPSASCAELSQSDELPKSLR